jgi:nicotinate-nucleotide--dimethylbenzimidazole phosphoribosyltransferase
MKLPVIPPFDEKSAQLAKKRQQSLTKPAGSLGYLETLSIQLAGMTGNPQPTFAHKGIIVMAADHGIAMEGVSAYPAEVTAQMVENFLNDGAAINVLAKQAKAAIKIVDIGVAGSFNQKEGMEHRKIAPGTQNMVNGPAMTKEQMEQAIQVGLDIIEKEISQGMDLVATGEMGIGNTSASSAITAVLTGLPVPQVTGRGTGIDDAALQHKIQMIEKAIHVNQPNANDPLDVLAKVGGLEIAGLVGVIIGAASRRVPVVVDGFISGAATLVAAKQVPDIIPYLIASHQSVEIGHQMIWQTLGLRPILHLDMRLGEGTGSALAFHMIDAAVNLLNGMATFSEAGVHEA